MATTYQTALRERADKGEVQDLTPIHIPGKETPLSLREEMRRYIREQISAAATQVIPDVGTFEEEDDFEEEDESFDILSKYTVIDMIPEDAQAAPTLDGTPEPAEPLIAEPDETPVVSNPSTE